MTTEKYFAQDQNGINVKDFGDNIDAAYDYIGEEENADLIIVDENNELVEFGPPCF